MKSLILIGSVASLVASAPIVDPPKLTKSSVPGLSVVPQPLRSQLFDSAGKLQSVLSNKPGAPLPQSAIPEVQLEKAKVFASVEGIVRRKIRYGPYRLPAVSEDNWQKRAMNLAGMADEYHYNITKPCTECIVASLSANLEYADGSIVPSANAWLHHSAVVVQGSKINDPVCGESNTETLFSSGNERGTVRFFQPQSPVKSGYRIHPEDTLTMVGEYKSEVDKEQYIWLTLSWEIFEGPQPKYKDAHVIWMSTIKGLGCAKDQSVKNPFGESNLTSAGVPKTMTFSEHSLPWNSPIDGTILGMGGHLHDGGISINLFQNGNLLCETKANYASGPAATGAMGSNHAGGDHVNGMTPCPVMKPIKKNDSIVLAANYDFTKHQGSLTETGEFDEVMGVGIVLVVT